MLLFTAPGRGASAAVCAGQHCGAQADGPARAGSDGASYRVPHSARAICATGRRSHPGESTLLRAEAICQASSARASTRHVITLSRKPCSRSAGHCAQGDAVARG